MDYKIDKTWAIFYKALAHKLLEYQNCRDQLIEKIRELYINTQINMPKLEINNEMIDMDPFTVFGLFNKSSMTKKNRIKIIEEMAKLFDVKADIPRNFDGIPTVLHFIILRMIVKHKTLKIYGRCLKLLYCIHQIKAKIMKITLRENLIK